jgi:hypothetical protein
MDDDTREVRYTVQIIQKRKRNTEKKTIGRHGAYAWPLVLTRAMLYNRQSKIQQGGNARKRAGGLN